MKFVIKGKLDGLNEYTRDNRANKYQGSNSKKINQQTAKIAIYKAKLKKVDKYPIQLKIAWYEPNKRRDIDNITFATKFILDALVETGIIENDSQKYVNSISHRVRIDKNNPRIEVEIERGINDTERQDL